MAPKKTTAPKPKPSYSSKNGIKTKYEFLCAATAYDLYDVLKSIGLCVQKKHGNGNIYLQCTKSWSRCKYRGLFVPKDNAIYAISGRKHNHPVKAPANKDNGEGEASAKREEPMEVEEANQDQKPIKDKEQKLDEAPEPTYFSAAHPTYKYDFLCAATAGDIENVCKRLGVWIAQKYKNGNISLECPKFWDQQHPCKYRALFVAKNNAIFVINGRDHNHPVKEVPANEAQKDKQERKPTTNEARLPVQASQLFLFPDEMSDEE